MRLTVCDREDEVREMAGSNAGNPELHRHVANCAVCTEVFQVAVWMQMLAEMPIDQEAPQGDAARIWWKAQLLQRLDRHKQAAAPVDIAEHVEVGVGLIGALALLVFVWGDLPDFMTGAPLMIVAILGIALLVSTAAFYVRSLVSNDGR